MLNFPDGMNKVQWNFPIAASLGTKNVSLNRGVVIYVGPVPEL